MVGHSTEFLNTINSNTRRFVPRVYIQWEYPYYAESKTQTNRDKIQFTNCSEKFGKEFLIDGISDTEIETYHFESNQISDWFGSFSAPYPEIKINFLPSLKISKITLKGTNVYDETLEEYIQYYPSQFVVQVNQTTDYGFTTVYTNLFNWDEFDANNGIIDLGGIYEGNQILLQIRTWSQPRKPITLTEFSPTIISVFNADDILSISTTNTIDNGNPVYLGSCVARTLALTLNNINHQFDKTHYNNLYGNYLTPNVKIIAFLGIWKTPYTGITQKPEYIPLGSFYVDNWENNENDGVMTVTANDILTRLNNYPAVTSGTYPMSTSDFINMQLNKCNISSAQIGILGIPINTEPSFTNGETCRDAIFYMLEAMGGYAYTSRDMLGQLWLMGIYTAFPSYDITINIDNQINRNLETNEGKSINYYYITSINDDTASVSDSDSINKYGVIRYDINNNNLIQTATGVTSIVNTLNDLINEGLFETEELIVEHAGLLIMDANDLIAIQLPCDEETYSNRLFKGKIISVSMSFDGGLKETYRIRKISIEDVL